MILAQIKISLPAAQTTAAPTVASSAAEFMKSTGSDMNSLILYFIASVIYIMVIHFAFALKNQFNLWVMGGIFVLCGVFGAFYQNYQTAFILAIILSLIFL